MSAPEASGHPVCAPPGRQCKVCRPIAVNQGGPAFVLEEAMIRIYTPDVLTPEELYNVLWRVYQYRQHWIVQREAGPCAVLMFHHRSQEALRFLLPDDLLGLPSRPQATCPAGS